MSYRCPECGSKSLAIIECVVSGEMELTDDGFEICGDTFDEVVKCSNCGYENGIEAFLENE